LHPLPLGLFPVGLSRLPSRSRSVTVVTAEDIAAFVPEDIRDLRMPGTNPGTTIGEPVQRARPVISGLDVTASTLEHVQERFYGEERP
jgi:hypothetical protein